MPGSRRDKKLSISTVNLVPRRVAYYNVETWILPMEDVWELQRPMEEAVLPGNARCVGNGVGDSVGNLGGPLFVVCDDRTFICLQHEARACETERLRRPHVKCRSQTGSGFSQLCAQLLGALYLIRSPVRVLREPTLKSGGPLHVILHVPDRLEGDCRWLRRRQGRPRR